MIIIDAKDLILGRLATFAVKQALMGETIHVINAEQAVITGDKRKVLAAYMRKRNLGAPLIGPFQPKMPDRLMKRTIRGMLDYNSSRGKAAFAKIKCHISVPSDLAGKETISPAEMNVEKTHAKYVSLGEISKELGAKF